MRLIQNHKIFFKGIVIYLSIINYEIRTIIFEKWEQILTRPSFNVQIIEFVKKNLVILSSYFISILPFQSTLEAPYCMYKTVKSLLRKYLRETYYDDT